MMMDGRSIPELLQEVRLHCLEYLGEYRRGGVIVQVSSAHGVVIIVDVFKQLAASFGLEVVSRIKVDRAKMLDALQLPSFLVVGDVDLLDLVQLYSEDLLVSEEVVIGRENGPGSP
jgi:hypothetical protein